MPTGEHDLSAIVAEQVEDYKRRLEVRFAAIEESRKKILRSLEGMNQDLRSIRAMLAEMRQHLSRPEDS
jgi:hypothetical protein